MFDVSIGGPTYLAVRARGWKRRRGIEDTGGVQRDIHRQGELGRTCDLFFFYFAYRRGGSRNSLKGGFWARILRKGGG